MECNECDKDWFSITIPFTAEDPVGFEDWCNNIEQCKFIAYLPDGTNLYVRLFRDHTGRYNEYDYKNFLLNRYNEQQENL